MTTQILLLCAFFLSIFSFGNSVNAQTDTLGLETIIIECQQLLDSSQVEKALEKSSRALRLSQNLSENWDFLKGDVHYMHGKILNDLNKYTEALDHTRIALSLFERDQNKLSQLTDAAMLQADIFSSLSVVDSMSLYYSKARAYARQIPDSAGLQMFARLHTNAGGAYIKHRLIDSAEYHLKLAWKNHIALSDTQSVTFANLLSNLGVVEYYSGRYADAIPYLEKSVKIKSDLFGPSHPDLARIIMNLGIMNYMLGDFENALEFYHRALAINEDHFGKEHKGLADLLMNIGSLYFQADDLYKALPYYERAQDIYKKSGEKNLPLAMVYNNLGSIYKDLDSLDKAWEYYNASISIRENLYGPDHNSLAAVYNNVGLVLEKQKEHGKAIQYLSKALEINRKTLGDGHYDLSMNYTNIAQQHKALENFERALQNIRHAYEIRQKILHTNHYKVAESLHAIGRIHAAAGVLDSALNYYEKALAMLGAVLPDSMNVESIAHPLSALPVLSDGAIVCAQQFNLTGESKNLTLSNMYVDAAIALTEYVSLHLDEDQSKALLMEKSYNGFARGIDNCLLLHEITGDVGYLNKAFELSEKSKSLLLIHALALNNQSKIYGVPDSIRKKESGFKLNISTFQNEIEQASQLADSESTLQDLNAKLFEERQAYYRFLDQIKTNFPNYFDFRYGTDAVSIQDIQKHLPEGSAFIEYFLSDSAVYSFLITPETMKVFKTAWSVSLRDDLLNLKRIVNDKSFDAQQFDIHSRQVYNSVFNALDSTLDESTQRLIIVPDGLLGFIPFELLKAGAGTSSDISNQKYLINRYTISYTYSGHFVLNGLIRVAEPDIGFIGFAPKYEDDNRLVIREGNIALPGARDEVQRITVMLDGHALLDGDASKGRFLESAKKAQVIHLAMHALTDDNQPLFSKLLFARDSNITESGFLYAYELFALKLNADLVVLSACNTGSGRIQRGEGINSLARAFSYAGVPATVMSLWNVPDQATSDIMVKFYEGLKDGQSKDEALRNAKLWFIENAPEPEFTHPYFWAGFVAQGDMSPVIFSNNRKGYWWLLLLCIVPAFFFGRSRFKG